MSTRATPEPAAPPDTPPPPDTLELRVHGVNNTSPSSMLQLPADAIFEAAGDKLGSFWRPRPEALASLPAQDPGAVPAGVLREAYSWGGMARNSIGGGSGWRRVLGAVARIGWTLLLPLAILNMAYWSRQLHGSDRARHVSWRSGRGGATIRVAALLLTLLFTMTGVVAAMDVLATQCYASAARCTNLPTWLNGMASWRESQRLAAMSAVPLALVTFLYLLSQAARVSYTEAVSQYEASAAEPKAGAGPPATRRVILADSAFWRPATIMKKTALLHLAAAATLITIVSAWQVGFGSARACADARRLNAATCTRRLLDGGAHPLAEVAIALAGIVLLIAIIGRVAVLSAESVEFIDAPTGRTLGASALGAAAGLLYAGQLVLLLCWPSAVAGMAYRREPLGVSTIPSALVAALLGLSLAVAVSRYLSGWRYRVMIILALTAAALYLPLGLFGARHRAVLWLCAAGIAAIVIIFALVIALAQRRGSTRQFRAWYDCAPGVWLVLATLFGMVLSAAVLSGLGNLLNGSNSAAALVGGPGSAAPNAVNIQLPRVYPWFGAALVPSLAILLGLLIIVLCAALRGRGKIPEADTPLTQVPSEISRPSNYPPIAPSVLRARWLAALAQRGERFLGVVAILGALGLAAATGIAVSGMRPTGLRHFAAVVAWLPGAGMIALAALGVAVITSALGTASAGTRPLGLVWDLACFLPKVAHPFGPPCYAERAVPELAARIQAWLSGDDSPPPGQGTAEQPQQRVVISAHSLGGLLAVAAIFTRDTVSAGAEAGAVSAGAEPGAVAEPGGACRPVTLLTYGCQLRAYFSRILPELFGPDVLGVPAARSARLLSVDPWHAEIYREATHDEAPAPGSVRALLRKADGRSGWINLWRRTDYLGFPAVRYVRQDEEQPRVDRLAQEVDTSRYLLAVLTHSDYPRTPAYTRALAELHLVDLGP